MAIITKKGTTMTGFWQGIMMGFVVAMPFGPICLLCVNHSLRGGFLFGLITGLGAAVGDVIFAVLGGMGLRMLGDRLGDNPIIPIVGAAILIYLGISTLRNSKTDQVTEQNSYLRAFLTTLTLCIANPMTILTFTALFTGTQIAGPAAYLGIFLAAISWYSILCLASSKLTRFKTWITRGSGVVLLGIAALNLIKLAL